MCQPAPSTPRCSRPLNAKEAWTPKSTRSGTLLCLGMPIPMDPRPRCACRMRGPLLSGIGPHVAAGQSTLNSSHGSFVTHPQLLHISTFGLTQPKSLPQACLGQTGTPRVTSNATSAFAVTPTMTPPFTLSQPPEAIWPHCAHVSSPRRSRSSHVICSARDVTKVLVNGELRDHNPQLQSTMTFFFGHA